MPRAWGSAGPPEHRGERCVCLRTDGAGAHRFVTFRLGRGSPIRCSRLDGDSVAQSSFQFSWNPLVGLRAANT